MEYTCDGPSVLDTRFKYRYISLCMETERVHVAR